MHIAVLVQDFPPETGAGPARISELADAWLAAGHKVSVLTGFPNRRLPGRPDGTIPPEYRGHLFMRETWRGIDVYRSWLFTSSRRGFATTLVNNLTFAISSFLYGLRSLPRPDILIASGPPYFAQFAGAGIAGLRGIPLILEIRDLWPDYIAEMKVIRSAPLLRAVFASERWLLRRASAVVVVTDAFRRRMIAKGVAPAAITVIPNGVDLSRYFPADERAPIEALEHREPSEHVVGYIGTFGAGQGLGALIDATRRLRARGLNVRTVMVGDGPHRSVLEAELRSMPDDGVRMHPPIPRDDTRAFYSACDVVVVPHAALSVLGETVPSKIFEVMACGRPLVAALQGEGARIVQESGAGVLASPGSGESLADAIERVIAMSDGERAALGTAGRAFAALHYDRAQLAVKYLAVLEMVAEA